MTANRKPSSSNLREHTDEEGSQSQGQNTLFVRKLQGLLQFIAVLAVLGTPMLPILLFWLLGGYFTW